MTLIESLRFEQLSAELDVDQLAEVFGEVADGSVNSAVRTIREHTKWDYQRARMAAFAVDSWLIEGV